MYLLDADTLIRADREAYPINRFPVLWEWLEFQGEGSQVKIAPEQYDEIVAGRGVLVDWLRQEHIRASLVLQDDVHFELVQRVILEGYAPDLNEVEVERLGRDPFLIAHALVDPASRIVVTFEVSAPSKRRHNRKVPDVCSGFGIRAINIFGLIEELDFRADWQRPE